MKFLALFTPVCSRFKRSGVPPSVSTTFYQQVLDLRKILIAKILDLLHYLFCLRTYTPIRD
ncbi:MAG: hypothetical protein MUE81_13450 [Thermoflexibacter sp.]|nr:hypothetical protein [Thermoflexibacter sp.]